MSASLLCGLYIVRSERQLVEQVSDNLASRWFVGLSIEDTVWNHSVFSKPPAPVIARDTASDVFNAFGAEERADLAPEDSAARGLRPRPDARQHRAGGC